MHRFFYLVIIPDCLVISAYFSCLNLILNFFLQRGLYFEITYSHLIADVHVRRQILSDAKVN